jgi:hypothetical protein
MDKTMVKAQIGAVLSNIAKTHFGCCVLHVRNNPKRCKSNVYFFSRKIDIILYLNFVVATKVKYHAWKRGKVINSVMVVP